MNAVWIIDDDRSIRWVLEKALGRENIPAKCFASADEALAALNHGQRPQVLVSDIRMPGSSGLDLLRHVKTHYPELPVIIMTAYSDLDSAVAAFQGGAFEYLPKPFDVDQAVDLVRRAIAQAAHQNGATEVTSTVPEILGQGAALQEVFRAIGRLSQSHATVLINGESGTGKELVARALHRHSPRKDAPFIAINTAAIPRDLLESELFGHEKGAFTGASSQHAGAFERADGGTLFLDEIGDAPANVQVKLLRALEEREIRRVGGREAFKVDVRLVSASNRDLHELIADGAFREDLLYRVNVVTISLPPLRHRREDIRPLTDRFIARAAAEHNRTVASVEPACYARLEQYDWPGNVRQLRNVVESAVLLCSGPILRAEALNIPDAGRAGGTGGAAVSFPEGMTLAEIERQVLEQTFARYHGNRTLTAEKLGLSRRTIQRKVKEHGLSF